MGETLRNFKRYNQKIGKFVYSQRQNITLGLALFAVVVSLYNSYVIKTGGNGSYQNVPTGTSVVFAPIKILDKIPNGTPVLGNKDAKVTFVEFGDYQCPYCEKFFSDSLPDIKKNYIDTGKIKFIFIDTAFLGQESKDAVEAAYCANEQGKFWQYHDALYKNQGGENTGEFSSANLKKFAEQLGLDGTQFDRCLNSNKYEGLISDELKLATSFGVNGTPTFIIGKQIIKGSEPLDIIKQAIDSELSS